jgi:hypothetical protein
MNERAGIASTSNTSHEEMKQTAQKLIYRDRTELSEKLSKAKIC